MENVHKETLIVRIISVGFSILAFVIFKPMRLDLLGWELYIHFLAIWVLGVVVCFFTEAILKYLLRMQASLERGVDYMIRRNLWFQIINIPLETMMMCIYLHYAMKGLSVDDPLSLKMYFRTLFLLFACSFAIGLFWRYKFRNKYLAAEVKEIRELYENKSRIQEKEQLHEYVDEASVNVDASEEMPPTEVVSRETFVVKLAGSTSESVTLAIADLLYVEAVGNYVRVYYLHDGEVQSSMLRATLKHVENVLRPYPRIVRCHRAYLVNTEQVETVKYKSGTMHLIIKHSNETVPVSRRKMADVRDAKRQADACLVLK